MNQITYTSEPRLRSPRLFFRELISDLNVTRELGWRLFVRDMRSQVRQSWLGYAWLLVPPLITSLVWIFLSQSRIINTNTADSDYPIFVISGIFIWQSFVETMNMPISKLLSQRTVLTNINAPHEAFVLAGLGGIVFNILVRIALIIILLPLFGVDFSFTLFLAPLGLLSVLFLGLSVGLLFTPIGMLYSDVENGLNAVSTLVFFVTPIIYQVPNANGIWSVLQYNPVTPVLVTTRNWIIGGNIFPEAGFFLVVSASFLLFLVSWVVYRLARPHLLSRV